MNSIDKKRIDKKLNGFTLTEMLVVLVIIGVLVAMALPNLLPMVARAKATEAKITLGTIKTFQKAHWMEHNKYESDLARIGFEAEVPKTEGGQANYTYEIVSADAIGFVARAEACVDFDQDGVRNVWEINERGELTEVTPD